MKTDLTAARVRELLDYNPETGEFRWRLSNSKRAPVGAVAGVISRGYRLIRIDGCLYRGHRLAWLHVHGHWPVAEIDHVNLDKADNRIANLREASRSQQLANQGRRRDNTSGFKGAFWEASRRKWQAYIQVNGRRIHLGRFATPEAAHAAYVTAAAEHFGEFARPA